jgi:hypothetical protein
MIIVRGIFHYALQPGNFIYIFLNGEQLLNTRLQRNLKYRLKKEIPSTKPLLLLKQLAQPTHSLRPAGYPKLYILAVRFPLVSDNIPAKQMPI